MPDRGVGSRARARARERERERLKPSACSTYVLLVHLNQDKRHSEEERKKGASDLPRSHHFFTTYCSFFL